MSLKLGEITHISLDFDGVIVDSAPGCAEEIKIIGENLTGKAVTNEDIFSIWGTSFSDFLGKLFPGIDLTTYIEERKRLGFHLVFPPLIPGSIKAIEILSEKISFSIVTNRENQTLSEIIEHHKIDKSLFQKIQHSDGAKFRKPHPRVFDDILVAYPAKKMMFVGDHLVDHQAAYGAGIPFVGVLSGGISTREDFLDAGVPEKMILNSLADLPARLGIFV